MTPYRIYMIDSDGHIYAPPVELECHSDHAAMTLAPALVEHHKLVEVWLGERLVGRVSADTAGGALTGRLTPCRP